MRSDSIDDETLDAMETHGGSFVQQLALLARRADPDNFRRLKAAFPEVWGKYAELAGMLKARREGR